jgi:hypothetical protein
MRTRAFGRATGLAAGLIGLVGWLYALLSAISSDSIGPRSVIFFSVMLLSVAGVALGAYRSNRIGRPRWFALRVVATLLLLLGAVLSGLSVGLFFCRPPFWLCWPRC